MFIPVGRLDYDSEGLLLLTNDKSLNHRLLHPSFAHEREYRVQVEGLITNEALQQLSFRNYDQYRRKTTFARQPVKHPGFRIIL